MTDSLRSNARRTNLSAEDGQQILVDSWRPLASEQVLAIVQIFHGLGEHPARYERFANVCAAQGYAVVAHAHRGHGESCARQDLGHFADVDGWSRVLSDAFVVQQNILQRFPNVPLVLLGHSMGSYIAQAFLLRHPDAVDALILSGSTCASRLQLWLGHWLAALAVWRSGPAAKSALLNSLSFGDFNKKFAPNRTDFDWLSRDEYEVDKYVADPLCGVPSSNKLWHDLTGGLLEITSKKSIARIPAKLPVLITGGAVDPVGGAKGLARLADVYLRTGHRRVALKVYDDARHEMLNEINRDHFSEDLLRWIDETI